jgi:hypothetical protein
MDSAPRNRPTVNPSDWKKVQEFEENGIIVSVSRLEASHGRPKFNIEISSRSKSGRPVRYFPMFIDGQGKVSVRRISGFVAKLINEAEDWIDEQAQKREDEFIEQRQAREMKQLDRDKPRPQAGIKTLGKRDGAIKAAQKTVTEKPAETPAVETPSTEVTKSDAAE